MLTVDLGVFAHNEAKKISAMIDTLLRQDIRKDPAVSFRILLLSNGSTDETVAHAEERAAGLDGIEVVDLTEGGKSRTWNAFVHRLSRPEADMLVFADADIMLPDCDTLSRLCGLLAREPGLAISTSEPVKDIVHRPGERNGLLAVAIAAAGGGLSDWRRSVCGQLYAMRAATARELHLPIGLPVEDGFVRALTLTRCWTAPENPNLIDGEPGVFHVYPSERTFGGLLRHQKRIVIGSAINFVIFDFLRGLEGRTVREALSEAANDETWLKRLLASRLPRWPYGFVPFHFLVKRLSAARSRRAGAKGWAIALAGFGFDALAWLSAQGAMARGRGAGYW